MPLFNHSAASKLGYTCPWGMLATNIFSTLLTRVSRDIDLVVSSESISRVAPGNALGWIARALKDRGLANNVQIIAKAKVPIVKFVTTFGKRRVSPSTIYLRQF